MNECTWEEALDAVQHDVLCRAESCVYDGGFGDCDCTRYARIAKGIEAAICTVVQRTISNCEGTGDTDNDVEAVFTAFQRGAK